MKQRFDSYMQMIDLCIKVVGFQRIRRQTETRFVASEIFPNRLLPVKTQPVRIRMRPYYGMRLKGWGKCIFLFFLLFCTSLPSLAEETEEEVVVSDSIEGSWVERITGSLEKLIDGSSLSKTSQIGLAVYDLTDDRSIFSYHADQAMRPASTQKLLTAITALDTRGANYTFQTAIYSTGSVTDSILHGDIYVKGGMDPAVETTDIHNMVNAFRNAGIKTIDGYIYADISFKDTLKWGTGWCWDDKNPLLYPLLVNRKKQFMPLFIQELQHEGLTGSSEYEEKRVPDGAEMLILCEHSMADILYPMMKKSDNLYAESMLFQLCKHEGLYFPSSKRSLEYVEKLASKLGNNMKHIRIADGSGLSLYNHTTPHVEVSFLRYAYRQEGIFPLLYQSLPIAGVDGTLKSRMTRGTAYNNVHAKTGTLFSVSSLAGYATASNGHLLCFCIINQGIMKTDSGRDFQDKVCQILTR